ncbi:MAG: hypothetical protein VX112_04685 [Pseudomonadota bacterium]|nr:hypothetical protein [Pseudomonadota bacterium]
MKHFFSPLPDSKQSIQISLTYLQSILVSAGVYMSFFMAVLFTSSALALPPLPNLMFCILYFIGYAYLEPTMRNYHSSEANKDFYNWVSFAMAALVAIQLAGYLSATPMYVGYFCLCIYSSMFVVALLVQNRDTIMPKFTSDFLLQSFLILMTNSLTCYVAYAVFQAEISMLTFGLAAVSSYVSIMYLLLTLKLALLDESQGSNTPPSFYGFLIFNQTLSLALDFFSMFMSGKSKEGRGDRNSRGSFDIKPFIRVFSILVDMLLLNALSKSIDVYITRRNSVTQPTNGQRRSTDFYNHSPSFSDGRTDKFQHNNRTYQSSVVYR